MVHSKIENLITKKTKGIIVVSLYGQMANIDEINEINPGGYIRWINMKNPDKIKLSYV